MSFHSWLQNLRSALVPGRGQRNHGRRGSLRATTHRPDLEVLEDRCLLSFSPATSYPVGTNPQAVVTADFNHDGKLDLAVANYGDHSVSVLLGKGDGTFQATLTSATGWSPVSLAAGDFDGDGKLDLATANQGDQDVSVLLGNGDGTFNQSTYIPLGILLYGRTYPQSVAVGDFNGDGRLDLGVTANYDDDENGRWGQANVLLGNGDGSFSEPYVTWLGRGNHNAAIAADLNGDGFDDFVTLDVDYGGVFVLLGDSSGYLQSSPAFFVGSFPYSVAAGDLNGDGHADLVTANDSGSSVSVLLGNGAGSFSAAANFATGGNPFAVVLGDFTGDGKVDVATANWPFNLSVLPGGGDGSFAAAVNSAGGSYPTGVAAGDITGDGWLDAAMANRGTDDVSVLINDHSWPPANAPSITISDVAKKEGKKGQTTLFTFTVTLSAAYDQAVTMSYRTVDGIAKSGEDYTAKTGTLTFAPGETTKTITIEVKGDTKKESNETFYLDLFGNSPDASGFTKNRGIGTILNDD